MLTSTSHKGRFLPGVLGRGTMAAVPGSVAPGPHGEEEEASKGILGSVRKRSTSPLRKKAFVSKKNDCTREKCHT